MPDVRPCDGCRHASRCKAEELACEAFVIYRRVDRAPERWAYAPRQPSKERHDRAHAPFRKRVVSEEG